MAGTMSIAASGMTADQNAMKNNSSNLANSNTIGYMQASSDFLTQVTGGTSGVTMMTSNDFDQPGPLQMTTRELDFATNGQGFIPVQGPDGLAYKKTASCSLDKMGVLLDEAGNKIMGMPNTAGPGVAPVFAPPVGDMLVPVVVDMASNINDPSSQVRVNSTLPVPPAVPPAGGFAASLLQMQVYDSLGFPHMLNFTWTPLAALAPGGAFARAFHFDIAPAVAAEVVAGGAYVQQTIYFDNQGQYAGGSVGTTTNAQNAAYVFPNIQFQWANGAAPADIALDLQKMTMLGTTFNTGFPTQDGSSIGYFSGISVGDGGVMEIVYTNGERRPAYKIPLAKFAAVNELERASGNLLLATVNSGPPLFNDAGTAGAGDLLNKALVGSATDMLANQVEMIELSQSNSANAGAFSIGREAGDVVASLMRG